MSHDETVHIAIELGKISPHVEIPELVVRCIDAGDQDLEEDSPSVYQLQGRITNATSAKLSSIKYDVAYYAADGGFLGLDKCSFIEDDELDTNEDFLAIDMELSVPPETNRCVFNCRALKAGFFARFFWG